MSNDCSNCPETVHVSHDEITVQVNVVLRSGVPITDRQIYSRRLEVCGECEELAYGTTCMSCGCLIRVRALNALRVCPHSAGNKW